MTSRDEARSALVARLGETIDDARHGLAEDVFLLVSRLTPMVNVDLLIRNERGENLLVWREDRFYGPGWHLPGGIVRFKEKIHTRIEKVALAELGCSVEFERTPLAVNELFSAERDVRGHFVSLLFRCRTTAAPAAALESVGGRAANGQWRWHPGCPDDLIKEHRIYRAHLASLNE